MKHLVILFILITAPLAAFAAMGGNNEKVIPWDSNSNVQYRQPPRETIDELRKNPSYNYERAEKGENLLKRLWLRFREWFFRGFSHNSWLKYVIGGIAILFIVFIILRVMNVFGAGVFTFAKSAQSTALNMAHPAQVNTKDELLQLLKRYRSNGAYREAVRILYLIYLKDMNDSGLIRLSGYKTNHDYVYELKNDTLRQTFHKLSRLYDYVWFGQFELANAKYLLIENDFREEGVVAVDNE
ncbi:MAG: hypothetical protein LBV41_05800 [Cytophagaceae bacterium]|jgi:hypothetical protein|nr:hypothetical protein [Cytophagaceae bacterium]